MLRFPVRDDGTLGPSEPYGPDLQTAPDGLAFDEAGNLWGHALALPTNLAFGGPDRRTVWVGNLRGGSLPSFRAAVPGLALAHQA